KGKPSVTSWEWIKKTDNKYASMIHALEKQSQHPLSLAIVKYLEGKFKSSSEITDFKNIDGVGVIGKVDDLMVGVGNMKLLKRYDIKLDRNVQKSFEVSINKANTVVFAVVNKKVVALISIADEIKEEAIELIGKLNSQGYNCVMLTGDNESTAKYISNKLGITKVISDVLPTEKADRIKELKQAMPNNELIVMVGDGINDAPALAQADVGIAMGNGSDIAMETGQVVIVGGNIAKIYNTLAISKKTISIIKQNLFWAFGYNVIGIPIAAGLIYPTTGLLLSPIMASAAMAFSSISVVLNSLRLSRR
ncbi:MAG TPA: HAD-IC family P-type ATPase, partial [Candidatus Dojkabacteria bacterium]|nr:HAD-IC family P-type ATPase [Candidatus Dojkabacteria bacterium]